GEWGGRLAGGAHFLGPRRDLFAGGAVVGLPQLPDFDLLHLQHGGHDTLHFGRILVLDHLEQGARHHLPGHAELVLEPAALHFLAARRELLPEVVHLLLRVAVHDQGDSLRELEDRPAVQRRDAQPAEIEIHGHHGALRPARGLGAFLGVSGSAVDVRTRKNRRVELRSFFRLGIEPQKWCDFLHGGWHGSPLLVAIYSLVERRVPRSTGRSTLGQDTRRAHV